MTGYNPAHYRAEGYFGDYGAAIYCTQCTGPASIVYTIDDPIDLNTIINATRQHHDDHHEGK